jgi:hypothetical protein
MEERNLKNKPLLMSEMKNESTPKTTPQAAGAPWWLVIVLGLGLVGSACYIAWMNSALPGDRKDFLSFFLGPRTSGTQTVAPDSSAIRENSLLSVTTLDTDSAASGWAANPEATPGTPDTVLTQVPPASAAFNTAIPDAVPSAAGSGYYIKAGEFKSKSSAQFRVSELRQGNYSAKIIEPDSSGGTFVVTAGEYTSYSKAVAQARTIGFILDISTSVVKKE